LRLQLHAVSAHYAEKCGAFRVRRAQRRKDLGDSTGNRRPEHEGVARCGAATAPQHFVSLGKSRPSGCHPRLGNSDSPSRIFDTPPRDCALLEKPLRSSEVNLGAVQGRLRLCNGSIQRRSVFATAREPGLQAT
jgi:hypothetical protein